MKIVHKSYYKIYYYVLTHGREDEVEEEDIMYNVYVYKY